MAEEDLNLRGQNLTDEKGESKVPSVPATLGRKSVRGDLSSALGGGHGPAIRVVAPGRPDTEIWLQGVPDPLLNILDHSIGPPSRIKKFGSFCKDIAPALTSAAAVVISLFALIYTGYHNWKAETSAQEQRAKAEDVARKKIVAVLIGNFGRSAAVAPHFTPPEISKREIAAMELAAYGEQALPAVRMAFGANDTGLREGGKLVAKEMYRGETIEHAELITAVFGYYRTSSPILQLSVLEWLVDMQRELSDKEGKLAVDMLKQSFGPKGENCQKQDGRLAMEATNLLPIWPSNDSKELLRGMASTCTDNDVRRNAQYGLKAMQSASSTPGI